MQVQSKTKSKLIDMTYYVRVCSGMCIDAAVPDPQQVRSRKKEGRKKENNITRKERIKLFGEKHKAPVFLIYLSWHLQPDGPQCDTIVHLA